MNEKNVLIEVNSLSLQSADPTQPLEVLLPQFVTADLIHNAQAAVDIIKENFPENPVGVSLHPGSVVDLNLIEKSDLAITSFDIPDLVTPASTLKKFLRSPQLINRIAWAINSTFGINSDSALRSHDRLMHNLENLSTDPFIRLSVADPKSTDQILSKIPSHWTVALEFDSEDMSLEQYMEYVIRKNLENSNCGMSVDLAHIFEYYKIRKLDDPQDSLSKTMNTYDTLLREHPTLVLTVDVNNLNNREISTYGCTHKGLLDSSGVLDIRKILDEYMKMLNRQDKDGRINIEFSPRERSLFLNGSGKMILFDQLEPIKKS